MRKESALLLFFMCAGTACGYAKSERDQWAESLWYPKFTNEEFVKVTGTLNGKPYEKIVPLPGPDGLYPLIVDAADSSGERMEEIIGVIKDTKPPVLRDLKYPETTQEDSVEVTGFVDDRPFNKEFGIAGPSGEYTLTVEFEDEAHNIGRQAVKVKKDRPLMKLESWLPDDGGSFDWSQLTRRISRVPARMMSVARAALVSLEASAKEKAEEQKKKIVAVVIAVRKRVTPSPPVASPQQVLTSFETPKPSETAEPAIVSSVPSEVKVSQTTDSHLIVTRAGEGQLEKPKADMNKLKAMASKNPEWKAKTKEKDLKMESKLTEQERKKQFGIVRKIQMPDERGGMTITIDNHRTGERTVIRKDLQGKEESYETSEIPENERLEMPTMAELEKKS